MRCCLGVHLASIRKAWAKLSSQTHVNLDAFLEQQRLLWNAALQERIEAYRKRGLAVTGYDQYKSLTLIRRVRASPAAHRAVPAGQGVRSIFPAHQER